ncbi:hypothetical protein [Oharaeibacter diazotrophicus]|uniref:Capsular polysaccharide biosynthesis protein n=1 Tax=Oharaeibacter diazotrophicus TaxID=1920512 RepID=A0A4R6RL78_9HYPH|nr:hypothetical protein [Oharaeibacter diazotrophicus]TDP87411.1 capsular polysaccharide biosynthesis protein [Oharaeibacter diazotrophicus]BBE70645.1 capsule polysaccharide biosynthesis protein [Pleomorphomonas sp. SM30]GLS77391.1 hypothetical protein GCM10007904_27280 [Oharaeibacter diazotrophicus]
MTTRARACTTSSVGTRLRRAVELLRARADALAFLVRLAAAVALHRRSAARCFCFAVSRNKHAAVRAEHPAARIVSCRIHKVGDGYAEQPAFVRRAARRLVRAAHAAGMPIAVWGYADRLALGVDFAGDAPVERLERAVWGPPVDSDAPVFAYVLDRGAPYFDGRRATDLERAAETVGDAELAEDDALLDRLLAGRFQKYAGLGGDLAVDLGPEDLVIAGQCVGDAAWIETDALVEDNVALVLAAVADIPARRVFYKPHPFNRTKAADRERLAAVPGLVQLDPATAFAAIVERRPKIAVATSGAGLEAAVRGCEVHTFGTSFYSHRGFTVDRTVCDRRRRRLDARAMLAVTLFHYTRYADRAAGRALAAREAVERILGAPAGGRP